MYPNQYNPYMQNYNQNLYSPYMNQMNVNSFPHYELLRVNGESGVDALQMNPKSSILVMDSSVSDKLVAWYVETDDAGAKSKCRYELVPYQPEPVPDMKAIDERLQRLEVVLSGLIEKQNADAESGQYSAVHADSKQFNEQSGSNASKKRS